MWYLMLALDLIFSLSNPFLPFNADNLKHHILAWPAAMIYCVAFRYAFARDNGMPSNHILLYLHLPAYVVAVYVPMALAMAWHKSRRLEKHAHRTTRDMAKLILPYLVLFGMYTTATFVMYLLMLSKGHETTTTNAVDQLFLVLECLCVFVLFCRDAGILTFFHDKSSATTLPVSRTMSVAHAGEDKLDVSNDLRKDVMKYTSLGIIQSINDFMADGDDDREISIDDYNFVKSSLVLAHGTKASTPLSFRACAPRVFAHIRQHFNVDPHFMLQSFDIDKILSEHGSEGRSGNIFYFTSNKQFMVKSVPKAEYDTLRAILPHYHRYLLSNPRSMLCRYFGCYSISLPVGTRRMYFVVMHNLFSEGPVHHRFDLKGNSDRRQAITSRKVENHIELARNCKKIDTLMMDIDFRKLCDGLSLSASTVEAIQGQLCDDIVFLASRGIIDYSVLLGVRFVNDTDSLPPLNPQGAGITSFDGQKVYYLGIVDMLQRYNWRWTLQRWVLGLICKDTQDVSAVPPELYASRLDEFVRSRMFDIPRWTERATDWRRTRQSSPAATAASTPSSAPTPSAPSAAARVSSISWPARTDDRDGAERRRGLSSRGIFA
ncbi:hypothetical protein PINS_up004834 [Pythium insidiosum]|nr:hypothetical protein PINS_up004834 [Pythium insidiosum]